MNNQSSKKQLRRLFVFISNIVLWVSLLGLWAFMWTSDYGDQIIRPFWVKGTWLVMAFYGAVLLLLTHMYGGFKVGYHKNWDIFFSGMLALCITNFLNYIQTCLLAAAMLSFWPVVKVTLGGLVVLAIWSSVTHWLYQKLYPPYNMLVIYKGKGAARALIYKLTTREDKYRVCEALDLQTEGQEKVKERMLCYTSVLFSDLPGVDRNDLLKYAYKMNISVYMTPKLSDVLVRSSEPIELFDSPLLLSQNTDLSVEQRMGKRLMDLVLGAIGLLVATPFMLIIAAAIKLDDGGPILYTQERLTLGGKTFPMYKFRSMVVNADQVEGPRLASEGDPRITKCGAFLRKFRLDELPQIFNILKGEMSIVGPRPEHPEIAAIYEQSIPEFSFRLNVKAGLTGYAQVIGKYNTTPLDKIKLDLMYITSYSFLLDIKIILMTPKILFKFDSTEGVGEEETIATLYEEE